MFERAQLEMDQQKVVIINAETTESPGSTQYSSGLPLLRGSATATASTTSLDVDKKKKFRFSRAFKSLRKRKSNDDKDPEATSSPVHGGPSDNSTKASKNKNYIRRLGSQLSTTVAKNYKTSPFQGTPKCDKRMPQIKAANMSPEMPALERQQLFSSASQTSLVELDDDDPILLRADRSAVKPAPQKPTVGKRTRDLLKITISGKRRLAQKSYGTQTGLETVPSTRQRPSLLSGQPEHNVAIETASWRVSAIDDDDCSGGIVLQVPVKDDDDDEPIIEEEVVRAAAATTDIPSRLGRSRSDEIVTRQPTESGREVVVVVASKPITDHISSSTQRPSASITSTNRLAAAATRTATQSVVDIPSDQKEYSAEHLTGSVNKRAPLASSGSCMHLVKFPLLPSADAHRPASKLSANERESSLSSMSHSESPDSPAAQPSSAHLLPHSLNGEIRESLSFNIGQSVRPPVTLSDLRHVTSIESDCEAEADVFCDDSEDSTVVPATTPKLRRIRYDPSKEQTDNQLDIPSPSGSQYPSVVSEFMSVTSSELLVTMPAHGDLILDENMVHKFYCCDCGQ